MKVLDIKLSLASALAVTALFSFSSEASSTSRKSLYAIADSRYEVKPARPFRGQIPWGTPGTISPGKPETFSRLANKPAQSFHNLQTYDFLEAPDGSTWFYTTEYDIETIQVSPWYKEENIKGYTFTIYDDVFNLVGTVTDKITLRPGETKVAMAVLDPYVSFRFFNSDPRPEVLVYMGIKTGAETNYAVHYYNKAYSIGGERDAEGNDICIAEISGRCADAFNATSDEGPENIFYTFVDDIYPNPSDYTFDQYIDYINDARTVASVYKKAEAGGYPQLAFTKDIYLSRYPGDTTSGTYLISRNVNGTPFFIFSQYEKPYLLDPTGSAADESPTPDNSLLIEVISYGTQGIQSVSTTKIPVEIIDIPGQVDYAFYSLGSVSWKDDIDMTVNGTSSAPAFIVTRDVTTAADLDVVKTGYYVYDNTGKRVVTIAENAESFSLLAPLPGHEPQAMFVIPDGEEKYLYECIDLYSGRRALSIPNEFNGELLRASCQRVAEGKGYKYVFEMTYDDMNFDREFIKRMAWISPEDGGTLEKIDYLNIGKDVMASTVNLYPEALSPHLYDSDDHMEYAILVKRVAGNVETTTNEFIIVDDSGEWYAHFTQSDGRGTPVAFNILPGEAGANLMMVFADTDGFNVDFYTLPFLTSGGGDGNGESGIEDVIAGNDSNITFDGTSLSAPGCLIEVYNLAGLKLARGHSEVLLSSLSKGAYVAVATDPSGLQHTLKIAVR